MRGKAKSKFAPILIVITVFLLTCGLAFFSAMQPTIHLATKAEVEAVIPKELLQHRPVDPAARKRYADLVALAKRFDPAPSGPVRPIPVWSPGMVLEFDDALSQGRIQIANDSMMTEGMFLTHNVVKALLQTAETSRAIGDTESATRSLILAAKFTTKVTNDAGIGISYSNVLGVDSLTSTAIRKAAHNSKTSTETCKKLLEVLPTAPVTDDVLAADEANSFQSLTLPYLPNPFGDLKEEPFDDDKPPSPDELPRFTHWKAPYDAMETARQYAKVTSIRIANTKRLLIDYDDSADQLVKQIADSIPPDPDYSTHWGPVKTWCRYKYRFVSNNSPNLFGRFLLSMNGNRRPRMLSSLRWRTMRNATRVLLASRLYRSTHGGALPPNAASFITYLGTWPTDLYDGEPMRYDANKQVVYSVGPNLKDDGGDIHGKPLETKDVGVSLKLDSN